MSDNVPWRVRWTNFRGYDRGPQIEFPALTLLIGRNNTGKTSTYAPLLLLRQTLYARNPETALLFRGELFDFGGYEAVVTDHDRDRNIGFYLDFGAPKVLYQINDSEHGLVPRSLEVEFSAGDNVTARLARSSVRDKGKKLVIGRTILEEGRYSVRSPLLPKLSAGTGFVRKFREALQRETPKGFMFDGYSGVVLPSSWRKDEERWQQSRRFYQGASDILEVYMAINMHIRSTLENIAYIGPLRWAPRRSYLLSAEPPVDVGKDGEWAPEILFRLSRQSDKSALNRVNEWLGKMGYGALSFNDLGEYFQVFIQRSKSNLKVNLADCGMGLSQLLPLLVQGCQLKRGGTLIAQQPEIHLNPAQQDILTDFLISLIESDMRVIIETHSEHVLTRMRRRIAEGNSISNADVALYFSENDHDRSHLHRINIGEWGEVHSNDWPKGFFGEHLDNTLKMAMAQSRRKQAAASQ